MRYIDGLRTLKLPRCFQGQSVRIPGLEAILG